MMKLVVVLGALAGFVQICSAAPACASGTLTSYVGLGAGGCTIGTSTLFNFQVLPGTAGATEILPGGVLISPLSGPSSVGLTTLTSVTSSAGQILESLFTYRISGSSYVASMITLSNSSETGDGAVTGLQNFCTGGVFGPDGVSGCTGSAGGLVTVDGAQNTDGGTFGAVSMLSVTNDLTIDGGIAGSASGGRFVDQFATLTASVPEPFTFWFTAGGLALLAARRIQRSRKARVFAGR